MVEEYISHAFEAGRRAKPDEFESGLAHLIGSRLIELGNKPRFDLRVFGGYDSETEKYSVYIGGEVSESILEKGIKDDLEQITLDYFNHVNKENLTKDDFKLRHDLKPQAEVLANNKEAGDSGNPIGVAVKDAPNHLPWERYLAVAIRDLIDSIYQDDGKVPKNLASVSGIDYLGGLKADGKVNVSSLYSKGKLERIDKITIAAEHEESLSLEKLRENLEVIVKSYVVFLQQSYNQVKKNKVDLGTPKILINGRGTWNKGGWLIDAGNREAKPYRDGFSTHGCNEDSFSGEDPTKVSATGSFLARYIAVQIVANDLADYAKVTLEYTIGSDEVGINVWTDGTGKISQKDLHELVRNNFKLSINDAIDKFDLWNPELYKKIVNVSDFFQDQNFPWNQWDVKIKDS